MSKQIRSFVAWGVVLAVVSVAVFFGTWSTWSGIIKRDADLDFADVAGKETEQMGKVVIGVDDQWTIRFYEGDESIFGYTANEVLGIPLKSLIPQEMNERHESKSMQRVRHTILTGQEYTHSIKCVIFTKDGNKQPVVVDVTVFPELTERGIRGTARIRRDE